MDEENAKLNEKLGHISDRLEKELAEWGGRLCEMCDAHTTHHYQIRIRDYDSKNAKFIYEDRSTCYKYVCSDCYNIDVIYAIKTPYGGYALPTEMFERLREERSLPDIKEPAEYE